MKSLKDAFNEACQFGYEWDAAPIVATALAMTYILPVAGPMAAFAAAVAAGHAADATIGKCHDSNAFERTGRYFAYAVSFGLVAKFGFAFESITCGLLPIWVKEFGKAGKSIDNRHKPVAPAPAPTPKP